MAALRRTLYPRPSRPAIPRRRTDRPVAPPGLPDRRRRAPRRRSEGGPVGATLTPSMSEHRYDPRTIEPKWQAVWERERTWYVARRRRLDRPERVRARDAALPLGRAAHGPHEELRGRRCGRALPPPQRLPRPPPDGLRRVRAAGREPRDPHRRAPARLDRGVDRRVPGPDAPVGHLHRLVARVRHARAALLPLDAVAVPAAARARAGLPQGGGRQLVPQGRDGAGQRAGDRRPLRALRHARRGAPAGAVVLPHHRLRRPSARRSRDDRLAARTS